MADVFTVSKRSEIMSRVKGDGNRATEQRLINIFRHRSITGWRRHAKYFGKPDFVFPNARVAIFVDGCFWHCCPVHRTQPTSNVEFWNRKLERNIARDRLVNKTLKCEGWKVLRIWQHELRNDAKVSARVRRALKNHSTNANKVKDESPGSRWLASADRTSSRYL